MQLKLLYLSLCPSGVGANSISYKLSTGLFTKRPTTWGCAYSGCNGWCSVVPTSAKCWLQFFQPNAAEMPCSSPRLRYTNTPERLAAQAVSNLTDHYGCHSITPRFKAKEKTWDSSFTCLAGDILFLLELVQTVGPSSSHWVEMLRSWHHSHTPCSGGHPWDGRMRMHTHTCVMPTEPGEPHSKETWIKPLTPPAPALSFCGRWWLLISPLTAQGLLLALQLCFPLEATDSWKHQKVADPEAVTNCCLWLSSAHEWTDIHSQL